MTGPTVKVPLFRAVSLMEAARRVAVSLAAQEHPLLRSYIKRSGAHTLAPVMIAVSKEQTITMMMEPVTSLDRPLLSEQARYLLVQIAPDGTLAKISFGLRTPEGWRRMIHLFQQMCFSPVPPGEEATNGKVTAQAVG